MSNQKEQNRIPCGVYRAEFGEVVETEKFLLFLYCSNDKSVMGMKLYTGDTEKVLCAVCERNQTTASICYAYKTDTGFICANDESAAGLLGETYDRATMRRLETFFVDHSGAPLPTVAEAGIKTCLLRWRMTASFTATDNNFSFLLCTGKTEYVFSIQPADTNIYCGASYNIPFDTGMLGGRQYFRMRNYQDNTAPFCGFYADFNYTYDAAGVPESSLEITCENEECVQTAHGLFWGVKRYTDDEIVLQGCGDDEYIYGREVRAQERFTLAE